MQARLSAVRSKLFLHEHENNTHEAEQALPAAWRGAGRSSRGTRLLLSSSDVPVADVFPCGVCCCIASTSKIKSSTEKQSSAIIVHETKRTATSTRTTHTRQNNPYRLGAAPAGVVGAEIAAVRTWCGGAMSISNAMPLRFASGVPYGFRDSQRFELVPKIS